MKKIALAICAASVLFGASKYEYEITPIVGFAHYNKEHVKDSGFFGLRAAKNLDLAWLSQIEIGAEFAPSARFKSRDVRGWWWEQNRNYHSKTNISRYYLDLVKIFDITDQFGIYGLIGAGYQHYSHSDPDSEKGGFGQVGIGLRYNVTDQFSIKLEGRELIGFKHGHDQQLVTLGFGIGLVEKPVAMPAPEPGVGDEDMDGVPDNIDRCPGTPRGTVVDEWGCEKVIRLQLGVHFAFDSTAITPEYEAKITEVSELLKQNPDYTVLLEGNTDSIGSSEYNMGLSKRRAEAVSKVLQSHGIEAARITTTGLGEDNPIATNETKEGRAQNRRVDAKFRK